MHLSQKEFSKITTLMFAAALDHSQWYNFLEYLEKMTGICVHMFGHDVENSMGLELLSPSYDPDFQKSYNDHYAALNDWAPGFFNFSAGEVISSEKLCSREVLVKTEFYNDWVLPQEDIIAGGGTILFKEDTRMFVIGGNIRRKDEYLEKDWLELLGLIAPHLRSALNINRVISGKRIEKFAHSIEKNSSAAVFVINRFKKVVFANHNGQEMLNDGNQIGVNISREITFPDENSQSMLTKAIFGLHRMNYDVSSTFKFTGQKENHEYSCHLARFDPRENDVSPFGFLISINEPCLLLTISKTDEGDSLQSVLAKKFGVTSTEAQVIFSLYEGHSPSEISLERNVSIHTIRNQIKSGMSKMHVNRQVELVKLVQKYLDDISHL